jgi:hypothetical protein
VIAFADEIHNRPVPLTNLNVVLSEGREFSSSQSAANQHRNHGEVSETAQALPACFLKKQTSLIAIEPVPGPRAQLLHTFDSHLGRRKVSRQLARNHEGN